MSDLRAIDLLVVDDDDDFRSVLVRKFLHAGFQVVGAANADEALELASHRHFDVALFDMMMPGTSGIELLKKYKVDHPACEVIILTGKATIETAVEAMQFGAYHYLVKPATLAELEVLIKKAHEKGRLRQENINLKTLLKRRQKSPEMVGTSQAMHEVQRLVERAGPSEKAILIQGASGTGKELVAQALHRHSPRADKPLVVINCAALPEALLESELFGHEKGAFTGAIAAKPGLFEVADGGTLFVDEIGELPLTLQAKLLRVLEDGSLRRVGSVKERRVNVRLIAATNKNLAEEIREGHFREDLYYRINVMSLDLPPLCERNGDIELLMQHFAGEDWKYDDAAKQLMTAYDWPGNVRQLINAIDRAKILADGKVIRGSDLPREVRESNSTRTNRVLPNVDDLATLERSIIVEVLQRVGGNKTHAAKSLGIHRRKLYRLLTKYDIHESDFSNSGNRSAFTAC